MTFNFDSPVTNLLACSRLRDSGESVNLEKERQKKAKVLFSRSLSNFRAVSTI